MRFFKHNFNPGTTSRGRLRSQWASTMAYSAKLILTAATLCAIMIVLHDNLIETAATKLLKLENAQLIKHKPELELRISAAEQTLNSLRSIDKNLNNRLFTSAPVATPEDGAALIKHKVLLAGVMDFQAVLDMVKSRSDELVEKSSRTNAMFGATIKITKEQIETLQSIPTIQPVDNSQIDLLVSGFGERINPFHKGKYNHPGVDFAAPRGSAVYATAPGKVKRVKRTTLQAGYGNYVEVDHGNGFVTRYAHLESISVKRGQTIFKGKVIGAVGSSGGSVAPHLHYEVMISGEPVNPVNYLIEGLTSHQYGVLLLHAGEQNQSLD